MEFKFDLADIKSRIFIDPRSGVNNYMNVSIEEMDWLVEQAEHMEKIKKLSYAEGLTLADFAKEVLRIIEGREVPTRKVRR